MGNGREVGNHKLGSRLEEGNMRGGKGPPERELRRLREDGEETGPGRHKSQQRRGMRPEPRGPT